MKKYFRLTCLILALLMILPVFSACGNGVEDETSKKETETQRPEFSLQLNEGKDCKYVVVRPEICDESTKKAAIHIKNAIQEKTKGLVKITEDTLYGDNKPGQFEILVGKTNRDESKQIYNEIKANDYVVTALNNKIVVAAYNENNMTKASEEFISFLDSQEGNLKFATENEIIFKDEYKFDTVKFDDTDLRGYEIILSSSSSPFMRDYAYMLQDKIVEVSGVYLPVFLDNHNESAKEILIGNTNREQSAKVDADALGKNGYSFSKIDDKIIIKTNDEDYTFMKTVNLLNKSINEGAFKSEEGKIEGNSERLLNAFCFTDVHNNWAMLEPPYQIRKNVTTSIDTMIRDYGQMDIVFVGGDLMSDYPSWNSSGWLPYKFYTEYKALLVEEFARLAKNERVHYTAGNHDYGQGETYLPGYNKRVNGGGPGPGINGSYNSYEFYFTGPMDKTFGVLPEEDMFYKKSTHTGEKYLLAFYYEIENDIGVFGLAPDPDLIWNNQKSGFNKESLKWLKAKLDEVDPHGNKVMFLNCHYVIHQRNLWNEDKTDINYPTYGVDLTDKNIKPGDIYEGTGDATELANVFKGHRNLFHLFGHAETWLRGYTSSAIFHYDKNGKLIPIGDFRRDSSEGVAPYGNRGFNSIYMGHFRPSPAYANDNDGHNWPVSWFEKDGVRGYAGMNYKWIQSSTGTPKIAQGMYIEVYEDRVVFDMKNFGTFNGWRYEDENVPYTVYLYR